MRCSILILLLCQACDLPDIRCEYSVVAAGMAICAEKELSLGIASQAERIVEIVEEETLRHYDQALGVREMLDKVGILVTIGQYRFVEQCVEIQQSGVYVCRKGHGALIELERGIIFLTQRQDGCFDPLIGHEILHAVARHMIDGRADHKTQFMFRDGSGNTIEDKVYHRIVSETSLDCATAK